MTTGTPRDRRFAKNPNVRFGDFRAAPFFGRNVLSVRQFDRGELEYIFSVASDMRDMVSRVGSFKLLEGKILANLFYEPSTRTSSSFMAAMQRLGGTVLPINEVTYSSVAKGESLPDTVRTLEQYADVIVLRHPEVGASETAAQYLRKPVINAGDGAGEHPTQALLDLFTIVSELGHIDGLTVTMVGDLKHGRTVHSLAQLLRLFDVRINYVSPSIMRMPAGIIEEVAMHGPEQGESETLDEVLPTTDVLYVTRVQKERFENAAECEAAQNSYAIDLDTMKQAKDNMIVMHPLPRVGEICMEVDEDPRAAYFRQMECGLYVRMALLAMVLGKA